MPKQDKRHFVPAALIGQFAQNPNSLRLRKSRISVVRLTPPRSFLTAAENVGHARDLYRGSPFPGSDNDSYFSTFEKFAQEPVSRIIEELGRGIEFDSWIKLAGYVTSQFTRAPELERSLDELAETSEWSRDQMDVGYILNTQRVSSAVVRARWEFMRTPKDLILNDRGLAPVQFGDWGARGYFFPLRKRFGLRIAGGPHPKSVAWNGERWLIDVPVANISVEQTDNLNCWTWCGAVDEVYGSSAELLSDTQPLAELMKNDLPNLVSYNQGAKLLSLPASQRIEDEMLLISTLGGINAPVDGDPTLYVI
ncbi:DUF4238 domain-containing protein [Agromyces sp. SYSU T0242]|uniref:DUF4238 domain-containing protein n=1 Tax=Agromyces litoreus TaxID=3158561 RepID=UPI003392A3B2